MAIAILKKKTVEDAKQLATKAVGSVKSALVVAGLALAVAVIALIVVMVK